MVVFLHNGRSLSVGVFSIIHSLILLLFLLVITITSHDLSPVLEVVNIVGEEVVLLRVDDGLHDFSRLIPLTLENACDNLHDIRNNSREAHEDLLHNSRSQVLQEMVDFIQTIQCGVPQLFQLRLDEVDKNIH